MIRDLTANELELVCGGSLWSWLGERLAEIWNAIVADNTDASTGPVLTASDLGQMQRDCVEAGGSFSYTQTAGSAGAQVRVVGVDGSMTYAKITCTLPSGSGLGNESSSNN